MFAAWKEKEMNVNGTAEGSQAMEVDSKLVEATMAGGGAPGQSSPVTEPSAEDPVCDPVGGSSSDSDDETPAEGEAPKASGKSPEDKLVKAVSYKDRGNACIAAGDSAGALRHYERGIKITSTISSDEQAKALLISLRLNLALACTKEERFFDAASAASKVLEVDAANVKALFRRGVARARLGALEDAKTDLLAVIKADPRNGGAKKELKLVRDRLVVHRQKEKASYSGLFDKGPMYNDKELERQKRAAEAAERLKQEEEEWAKVNEKRKADGKEELTLENWRKEEKEAEEKAKKEREEKEKKKPRPPPPTEPAAMPKKPAKKEGEEGDEMELDEDDLKIIQDTKKGGYCYFKRTLSEKDQSLLDAEQMKLRARVSSLAPLQEKGVDAGVPPEAGRSAWNEAGTWEEVEKTDWCKGKITEALRSVSVNVGKDARSDPKFLLEKLGSFDFSSAGAGGSGGKGLEALNGLKQSLAQLRANVTNVEIVGGDAHVICVSNKIKHIFDFNVKVKFSLSIDESMGLPPKAEGDKSSKDADLVKTYKGELEFPDMTNSDVDNEKFDSDPVLKWDSKTRWEATYNERVDTCIVDLKGGLLSALGTFFEEYKSS